MLYFELLFPFFVGSEITFGISRSNNISEVKEKTRVSIKRTTDGTTKAEFDIKSLTIRTLTSQR